MLCSFFFNDTATTEIYTLSLHDALPIYNSQGGKEHLQAHRHTWPQQRHDADDKCDVGRQDRKSTRLNSSHSQISYAVFCLKKKRNPSSSGDGFRCALPILRNTH